MLITSGSQSVKIDQYLISHYCITTESFTKIMRIQEMIPNLRCFDC